MLHLISIKDSLLSKYRKVDKEILEKSNRPVALVLRLKYRGINRDFAVPLRSNISSSTPPDQYFPLPNRSVTKPHHHHGLHYIKMFPVSSEYYEKYRIEGNLAAKLCLAFIDKREKDIVQSCQAYLSRYEAGYRPMYSTDLDLLLNELDKLCKK